MTWFFAVLVVAVMGVVAVVATGRGGTMSEAFDDRPDVRVPADRPLTAGDLRQVRFTTALRGYRAVEVDALLDRLAAELEARAAADARVEAEARAGAEARAAVETRPDAGTGTPG